MEIKATITSRSGRILCQVSRTMPPKRPRLVSLMRHEAPLVYRRDWFGPESVTIEIRDPGEGK